MPRVFLFLSFLFFSTCASASILVVNSRDNNLYYENIKHSITLKHSKASPVYLDLGFFDKESPLVIRRAADALKKKLEMTDITQVVLLGSFAKKIYDEISTKDNKNIRTIYVGGKLQNSINAPAYSIYDGGDVKNNIDLINQLYPNVKKIYVDFGDNAASHETLAKIKQLKYDHARFEIKFINKPYIVKHYEQLKLEKNAALILANNQTQVGDIFRLFALGFNMPVISLYQYQMVSNVLGGYVIDGESIGEKLTKIINHETVHDFNLKSELKFQNEQFYTKHIGNRIYNRSYDLLHMDNRWLYEHKVMILLAFVAVVAFIISLVINYLARIKILNTELAVSKLKNEVFSSQTAIILTLSEAVEAISKETGLHVKRIALMSKLLGVLAKLSPKDQFILENSSPMHDIGKIYVPSEILGKPGKLTQDEWSVMKKHTTHGYNLLKNSSGELIDNAAIIALQHHEKWNGKGYPNGLKQCQIHIYARIVAIVDVFDALSSERVYKDTWDKAKIMALFRQESGQHFDPKLCQLFLDNIDSFYFIKSVIESKQVNQTYLESA